MFFLPRRDGKPHRHTVAFIRLHENVVSRHKQEKHVFLLYVHRGKQSKYALFVYAVEGGYVGAHKIAFHYRCDGHTRARQFDFHVGRRERFRFRFREHRHRAVGFDDCVFHLRRIEISVPAQRFQQVVDVHIQFFHNLGEYIAAFDDNHGLAVEHFAETQTLDCEFRNDDVHEEQCEHGDDSVHNRNVGVAHRYAGEFAGDESYGKFERLQFAQLPLAHKPHCDQQKEVDYYAPDKQTKHSGILPPSDVFMRAKKVKFNIDHHISNTRFADYNYVDDVAATCEIMVRLSEFLGGVGDVLTANFLMMGLSSDTGNFAHKNVTADTFRAAAYLAECGADINLIQYNMFKKQSRERAALFGETMAKIRYFEQGRIAVIAVTQEGLARTGATSDMTEGFIDFPLGVEGVEVAACLLETAPLRYKISLRSKGEADVNKIASVYGGGGHVLASGCMIGGELEEVVDKLRYTITQHLTD